jgi:calcium-dependent protein kinase
LDHPNIVRIEEVYESTSEIFIVQELCLGGDLFDRLDEQPGFRYNEVHCAKLVKQILGALHYIHSRGIIHRDLKLENFLFTSTKPDSQVKMIDFGLSKHFEIGQQLNELVGTPYTVAPEILNGRYDEKCDVWAIGVITYLLISGETPFGGLDGENLAIVRKQIMAAKVQFSPDIVWNHVSNDAKNFVKLLLTPNPLQRPSAKECQSFDWIKVWAQKSTTDGGQLNQQTLTSLLHFKEKSDIQKLLSEVLSFTLLPEQIEELRIDFEQIDVNGDGEITLDALKNVLLDNAEEGALGALSENEIEDVFDSLRVRKDVMTIRWHEFLAAGLSQARIDDRNLRLAFDRFDYDHKGYEILILIFVFILL